MKKIAIIIASRQGLAPALTIHRELPGTELFYAGEGEANPCTSIDSMGRNAISVLSGHVGGANALTRRLAAILGAVPVITTQSDNNDLWALDTIHERFEGWIPEPVGPMNEIIYKFVNRRTCR